MIGIGRSFGAITVTNALPTGVGCAVGVSLAVEARVAVTAGIGDRPAMLRLPEDARTPLVEQAVRTGLATYFPEGARLAALELRSEVPIARGLKSSSAVSTAILVAVARAADRRPSDLEIGRLSAQTARESGVSATGALDDALAGLDTGFVVTDNHRGVVLRRGPVDPAWGALLYVPRRPHPPAPLLREAFSREIEAGELAARAAVAGDWARAMALNSEVVERAMGYDYGRLRQRLIEKGAFASGVSGLGPALGTIAPLGRLADLRSELPEDDADRFEVSFLRGDPMGGDIP
jgi:shikimate kinase